MANYDGLTRTNWAGTWSVPNAGTYPIVIDQDLRGTLQFITGDVGDQLTDITGQRLEEGMLVYVKNAYTAGLVTRNAETYYQYKPLSGEVRNPANGELPNAEANWSEFSAGGEDNNLIFTTPTGEPNKRQLFQYKELGVTYTVRAVDTIGSMFNLTLATFTPTFSAQSIPSTLNWDDPCTGFIVSVVNPADFLTQYISELASVTQVAGTFSSLGNFSAGSQSATPSGGVSWNQQFDTDGDSYIQTNSTNIQGGISQATLVFTQMPGSLPYSPSFTFTVTWKTPALSMSVPALSGKTFLENYTSANYSIGVTNITNSGNYSHSLAISPSGSGTTSPANPFNASSGTFTFSNPLYYYDSTVFSLTLTTTFTRPSSVTGGTGYSVPASLTPRTVSRSFLFPSIRLFKSPLTEPPTPPSTGEIVSGDSFIVTTLNNLQHTFSGELLNGTPLGSDKIFWFGVYSGTTQPTSFKLGTSVANAVDVSYYTNTVDLYPTPTPPGYVNATYNLYGILIQGTAVQAYVIIS